MRIAGVPYVLGFAAGDHVDARPPCLGGNVLARAQPFA
jgi:hypothetical protein